MRIVLISASLAFAFAASSAAVAQWYQDGKPLPPGGERSVEGKFSVLQVATDDSDAFLRAWAVKTPGASLSTTTRTVRNKPITTYLIFAGCAGDRSGKCDVTADFEVVAPDGKVYSKQRTVPVWRYDAPNPAVLQLSEGALGLRIEDGEALGSYSVRVTTTDHVANIALTTEQTLTVSEAK